MIGARVRVLTSEGGSLVGTVIAESENSVGVRLDENPEVPAIVPKHLIGVVLT